MQIFTLTILAFDHDLKPILISSQKTDMQTQLQLGKC